MTRRLLVFCLLIAFGTGVHAGPDVETQCLDCHRAAQRRGDVPLIEGQHREYLEHQLLRFRERHRDSFPMSAFTGGMEDGSLRALATTLAARPWRGTDARTGAEPRQRGATAARRRDCASCHGLGFEGSGDIARLAGQEPGYLARQIEGFGRGSRYHPPSGTGAPMHDISPAEAQDLAAYFSAVDTTPSRDDGATAE